VRRNAAVVFPSVIVLLMAAGAAPAATRPQPGEEGITVMKERMGLGPVPDAPDRPRGEGEGPFDRLVIRGAVLVDGTGAPPNGPVDIVVAKDRITEIRSVGAPGMPIVESRRPEAGDRDIDATGMYVLPGFVDAHAHIATPQHGLAGPVPPAEYVFKLWMAHGITTVREVGSGNGLRWTLAHKQRSAANLITAPRIYAYAFFPTTTQVNVIAGPEDARAWVRSVHEAGADGIKFLGSAPDIMQTALQEAKARGMGTACHHAQLAVTRMNVLDTSGWGLGSMEHWYGLPEALFTDRTIQDYPAAYNYSDEQDRFRHAGRLWAQAAQPGSERWNEVLTLLRERDFTLVPTFTIYEASRDLMRAMRAEWHPEYTWPSLMKWFEPSREAHGSYWFDWTTEDEIEWKRNYAIWMRFINDYKNRGGRVAAGSDAGFIYKIFGFDYVRELELLQEAGFHPLEVIRAATLDGAELVGAASQIGSIEIGKKADLVLVAANPIANLKVLYGTGAVYLNDETGAMDRRGGVSWTIKDGIVYDAKQLLRDAATMVAVENEKERRQPVRGR